MVSAMINAVTGHLQISPPGVLPFFDHLFLSEAIKRNRLTGWYVKG